MNPTPTTPQNGATTGLALDACSLPVSSVYLLLEADLLIRRAILMLDGWERAEAWCDRLDGIRAELEHATSRQPRENVKDEPRRLHE